MRAESVLSSFSPASSAGLQISMIADVERSAEEVGKGPAADDVKEKEVAAWPFEL